MLDRTNKKRKEAKRKRRLFKAITKYSSEFKLSFELVAAIVLKESHGSESARRYERIFFRDYIEGKTPKQLGGYFPDFLSLDTELNERAVSWGAAQVLGQTARELGFDGDFAELLIYDGSIRLGCMKLRQCFDREPNPLRAIARYNGNPDKPRARNYALDIQRIIATKQFEGLFA